MSGSKQIEPKKGYRLVFFGLLFFLNPQVSFLDLIPDFLGCMLILSGLSQFLFVDARAASARRTTVYLFALSVVRTLLAPVFFWSSGSSSDQGNTNMLLSFSFGVLCILLEGSLVRDLFEMYNYLAVRHDSKVGIKYLELAQSTLTVFVYVKHIAAMIPDFVTLFSEDSTLEYNTASMRMETSLKFVRIALLAISVLGVLILGILAAVRLRRFFAESAKEGGLLDGIRDAAMSDEGVHPGLRIRFAFSGAFSLLIAASLFCADYYFDSVSVLPTALVFVFAAFILHRLKTYRPAKKWEYALCCLGFVIELAIYLYRVLYTAPSAVAEASFSHQPLAVVFGILQAALAAAAFCYLAVILVKTVFEVTQIDLKPRRNAAIAFCLLNAVFSAYYYFIPRGEILHDMLEGFVFLVLLSLLVFVFFTWRLESGFHKEAEWKLL